MSSTVHTIPTTIHGRFVVRAATGRPCGLLVACHGYAQRADGFATDVDAIPGVDRWLLVSVQALNRFYTRAGDIVANWMTSQDRDLAMADNIAYLRAVLARVRADHADDLRDAPTVFLGFSQGTAMAYRAATDDIAHCAGIIALGGDIPADVRARMTSMPPVLIGRGCTEEWYTAAKLATDTEWLRGLHNDLTVVEYEGGHEWTQPFRDAAGAFLARIGSGESQK